MTDEITPEPKHVGEELARKYRLEHGEDVEGTRESLERCANMLDTYSPDCFPANELGQVHFARAMMDGVADEIRKFLGNLKPVAEIEYPENAHPRIVRLMDVGQLPHGTKLFAVKSD